MTVCGCVILLKQYGKRYLMTDIDKAKSEIAKKREGIREELVSRIYGMERDNLPLGETVDGLLGCLHSQGVVIKADRELPEIIAKCCCETHPEIAETGEVGDGQYHACEDYRERTEEAGFVAVEPLIDTP